MLYLPDGADPKIYSVFYITDIKPSGERQPSRRFDASYLTPLGVRMYIDDIVSTYPCEVTWVVVDAQNGNERTIGTMEPTGLFYGEDGKHYIYDHRNDRFNQYGSLNERFLKTEVKGFEDPENGPRILVNNDYDITFDDGAHFTRFVKNYFRITDKIRWSWQPLTTLEN